MQRSKKILFVSHCILNQNVKAKGTERAPGAIKELLELFSEAEIGLVQLPCPELELSGLDRAAKAKEFYDTNGFRKICKKYAVIVMKQAQGYLKSGYSVLGILGVEFSPTCAVYQITNGSKRTPGKGIFIEELEAEMRKKRFQVPIIGVNLSNIFTSLEKLQSLLKYS